MYQPSSSKLLFSINSPSYKTMNAPKPYFIFTILLVCSLHLPFSALACSPQEKQTLQDIMNHFGPLDPAFFNWYSFVDCCYWNGVGCNTDGRVISLHLRMSLILGKKYEIPAVIEGLTLLKSLKLYVSLGTLTGPIPRAVAHLYEIKHMDLSGNSLTGSIPGFIGQLDRLKHLDLTDNKFSNNITQTLGFLTELKTLKLGGNQLTGSIPSNFGQIRSLEYLDMSRNKLYDSIPEKLARLTKLTHLNLRQNQLTGSIPAKLGELPLNYFDVSYNQLVGPIPASLSRFGKKSFKNNKGLCGYPLTPCSSKMVDGKKEIVKEMLYMIE